MFVITEFVITEFDCILKPIISDHWLVTRIIVKFRSKILNPISPFFDKGGLKLAKKSCIPVVVYEIQISIVVSIKHFFFYFQNEY